MVNIIEFYFVFFHISNKSPKDLYIICNKNSLIFESNVCVSTQMSFSFVYNLLNKK